MLQDYELIVVLNPTLTREETAACWERIKERIGEGGNPISYEEQWGTRRLAYPIRKVGQTFTEGTYILSRFQAEAGQVKRIEENLRLMEEVLRFLLVKAEGPQKAVVEAATPQGGVEAEAPSGQLPEGS